MTTAISPQHGPVMPRSHVGFDSITTQIERKLLKRGFQFNVICVGRRGADLTGDKIANSYQVKLDLGNPH